MTATASGTYDNSFTIGGTITGSAIAASTALPISYNFTLGKNAFISGDVIWVVKFSDSVNTSSQQIATGTLSAASAVFADSGTYNFTSGVSSGATFLTTFQLTYAGAIALNPPIASGAMSNTGFGGEGITLNPSAIPEPSAYTAIAGLAALGLAGWRRRRLAPR